MVAVAFQQQKPAFGFHALPKTIRTKDPCGQHPDEGNPSSRANTTPK